MPYWNAYWADIFSPNNNISLAFFWELIERTSYIPGVVQNNPHLIPGHPNSDFVVAKTISQAIASWKPAATAIPLTAQIVGIETDLSLSMTFAHYSNINLGYFAALNSFKSCPAEKTSPSLLNIII